MTNGHKETLVFALAAIALVGIVVLVADHRAVPAELWTVEGSLVTAGLGIMVPNGVKAGTSSIADELRAFVTTIERAFHHKPPPPPAGPGVADVAAVHGAAHNVTRAGP